MSNYMHVAVIVRLLITAAGLVAAVFVGMIVGEERWGVLSAIAAALFVASVSQFAVRNLAAISLVLVTLDLWMRPFGFKISPMEQVGFVLLLGWMFIWWQRDFNRNAPRAFLAMPSFHAFRNIVIAAALYAVVHFFYNSLAPYEELAFGWKAASKVYAQTFGVFVAVIVVTYSRLLFPIDGRRSKVLLLMFVISLLISVSVGVTRAVMMGPEISMDLSYDEAIESERLFLIPVLNAWDSLYTLRTLGPAAVLVGCVFLFLKPPALGPSLPVMLIGLGALGSLVSGGRAALIFSLIMAVIAMIYGKRIVLACAMAGLTVVCTAALLVLPISLLREAPWTVQRSVGLLRPDLKTQATAFIDSSSNMRWIYFLAAWRYYTAGDTRLILTGRSAGQMDDGDILAIVLKDERASIEFAIKRLVTHNGLTDFLLGWGLIGYVLIMAMCISCCVMLASYMRKFRRRSHGSCWIFIANTMMIFWLVYTHFGGTFIWPIVIVFVLVALSQTDGLVLTQSTATNKQGGDADKISDHRPQALCS